MKKGEGVLGAIRISLGLIFFWAFFDKLFGLGFATPADKSWILGGSPTFGFLSSVQGPFASIFNPIAGNIFVDWIFMFGLLLIGGCLILGICRKVAGYSGALIFFLMWLAVLPIAHHLFLDEHIIYALVLIFLAQTKTKISLVKWWSKIKLVKKYSFLE